MQDLLKLRDDYLDNLVVHSFEIHRDKAIMREFIVCFRNNI